MKKLLGILVLGLFISSCVATGKQTLSVDEKISAPKIIALNVYDGGPWMREIEKRLKQAGFTVLRSESINEAIEVEGNKVIKYNEATTRYFLLVDALAPVDFAHRCFGGGYNFDYINADLIDLRSNQTIAQLKEEDIQKIAHQCQEQFMAT